MVLTSMRCPRCGLTQWRAPSCKRCGAAIDPDRRALSEDAATDVGIGSPSTDPAPRRSLKLTFQGSGGTLFGIQIVNVLLILVTLGIYSFWAKVRVRKFLMSQTEFEGDRFAYHGTGRELLKGTLKAGLVFGLPAGLLNTAPVLLGTGMTVTIIITLLFYGVVLLFIPFATVGIHRYRLSRTSWRGIRFSFRGRALEFVKFFISAFLLSLVTLGLYYPFFAVKRYGFITSNTYFGNQGFKFDGAGRELFWSYVAAVPLSLLTLGIYLFWFEARKQRYLAEHTSFADARFRSTLSGGGLLRLTLENVLLLVFTLGLANPWIRLRTMRFYFDHISLEGRLDLPAIQQEAQMAASTTGEGLGGFLDLDFDLG